MNLIKHSSPDSFTLRILNPIPMPARNNTKRGSSTNEPTRVVLIILQKKVSNPLPITLSEDDLTWFWVLSQYGVVEMVKLFKKDENQQLLVQFESVDHARSCHEGLDGEIIGGVQLVVMSSPKESLELGKDSKCRSFHNINQMIRNGERKSALPKLWCILKSTFLGEVGNVMHVSGLITKDKTCSIPLDTFWRMAGQYGSLVSARMLKEGQTGCALFQFMNNEEATSFRDYTDALNLVVNGKPFTLEVTQSYKPNAASWSRTGNVHTKQKNTSETPKVSVYKAKPSDCVAVNLTPDKGFYNKQTVEQALKERGFVNFICTADDNINQSTVLIRFPSVSDAFLSFALNATVYDGCEIFMRFYESSRMSPTTSVSSGMSTPVLSITNSPSHQQAANLSASNLGTTLVSHADYSIAGGAAFPQHQAVAPTATVQPVYQSFPYQVQHQASAIQFPVQQQLQLPVQQQIQIPTQPAILPTQQLQLPGQQLHFQTQLQAANTMPVPMYDPTRQSYQRTDIQLPLSVRGHTVAATTAIV